MSLVAWYPLSGDMNDYSKNGNHLSLMGETTNIALSDTGKMGKAYYKNHKVNSTHLKSKRNIDVAGNITMSCWVYLEESSNPGGIVTNHDHNTNSGWGITSRGEADGYCFSVNIGYGVSREYNVKTSTKQPYNKWAHFTFTFNINTLKLKFYVNGVYDKEFTLDNIPVTNISPISIFAWSNGYLGDNVYRIKGKIQNVKIYDHCLSPKELRADYRTKLVDLSFSKPEEPSINLITNGDLKQELTNWSAQALASIELVKDTAISDIPFIKVTRNPGATGFDGIKSISSIPIISNSDYTISVEIYLPERISQTIRIYAPENDGATHIDYRHYITITPQHEPGCWHKFKASWVSGQNAKLLYSGFRADYTNQPTPTGNVFYMRSMVIENKDHKTLQTNKTQKGKIVDSSGLNNHAYFNNIAPEWMEESPIGIGSYHFKAKTDQLKLKNDFLVQDNMNQCWTVSSWVKIDADYPVTDTKVSLVIGLNFGVVLIHHTSDKPLIYLNNGVNDSYQYGKSTTPRGVWFNIIYSFEYEKDCMKIFINGEDVTGTGVSSIGKTPLGIKDVFDIGHTLKGNIANLEIYATAFTLEDAKDLYNCRASIDKNNSIHINTLQEATKYEKCRPNKNLITNGFLEYGDTRNFTNCDPVLITDDKLNGYDCVEISGNRDMIMDECIEIDPNSKYELSGMFKSAGSGGMSVLFYGMRCYDKDFNTIENHHNYYKENTKTTLARQLNKGDTKIYLTSAANWLDESVIYHQRCIGFFTRPGFPNYKSCKFIREYLTINFTENYITINPYDGEVMPEGTKVANCQQGSTYLYSAASAIPVSTNWTKYSAIMNGMQEVGADVYKFRPGTKYVRICGLINYKQDSTFKMRISQMYFKNLTTNQVSTLRLAKMSVTGKSILDVTEVDTVGPTNGLIFWSDLEYDKPIQRSRSRLQIQKSGIFDYEIEHNGKKITKFNSGTNILDYIKIDIPSLNIMSQSYEYKSFTLHSVVKIDEAQATTAIVLVKPGYHSGLTVEGTNARFTLWASDSSDANPIAYRVSVDISDLIGQWISITGVYENCNMDLYINGIKKDTGIIPQTKIFNAYAKTFYIGGLGRTDGLYKFKGAITNSRIYDRALNEKEIKTLENVFRNNKYSINKNGVINCNDIIER